MPTLPILLPLRSLVHTEEVLAATGAERILVADCYVAGCESWTPKPWGWETVVNGRTIINIDHHAADKRFYRHISSGNLAIEYRRVHEPAETVVVNHTDCDSVISSGILCGLLDPKPLYGDAVIAADHTGEVNPIADVLQSLDALRDYNSSIRNLHLLEAGAPLEPAAQTLLEERFVERGLAARLISEGAFEQIGAVAVATLPLEHRLSGEFLAPLLPNAWAIVAGTPMRDNPKLWENKVRLGPSAPEGLSLFDLGVLEAEPLFGGRWNAGSTRRAGGSSLHPRTVAQALALRIARTAGSFSV